MWLAARGLGLQIKKGLTFGLGKAGDLAGGVANIVIDILNSVIQGINDFIPNSIGSVKVAGKTIFPGLDLPDNPIPTIPRLEAGGRVLQTGLAVVEQGEVWSGVGPGRTLRGGDTFNLHIHTPFNLMSLADQERALRQLEELRRRRDMGVIGGVA
jgi:hypothetical protein